MHITGKHIHATLTKHIVKKRHAHTASGLYLRPGWAAVCFKIIARCSQSTMDSGRGMGGRDFKSKHQTYMGQLYTSATWRGREENTKQDARQEDAPAAIDLHVCIDLNLKETHIYSLKPADHTRHTFNCKLYFNQSQSKNTAHPFITTRRARHT